VAGRTNLGLRAPGFGVSRPRVSAKKEKRDGKRRRVSSCRIENHFLL